MRSKSTNILQMVVLISGILFIAVGILFFLSPIFVGKLFGLEHLEDWFNQIKYEEFAAPLYLIVRGFAAMVFSIGTAMVLPLFDPLRYRGLIYFSGLLFPAMASWVLVRNGISLQHTMAMVLGFVFLAIFIMTLAALVITGKAARSGRE